MSSWQPIIGLEVHVELKTKSKVFCSCPNHHFRQKPNTNVCPTCLGLPGALPVPNIEAIKQTVLIGLAFNSKINRQFWFDRKNYFYPDLSKGYQISQHFQPIAYRGSVPILLENGFKQIFLDNIHLEEDTGKLLHTKGETLIDFNRSGVPLVEIVTQPCLHSGQEAKVYLQRLQQALRWLEVSDCDMEKGSMRLEANISIRQEGENKLPPYKVEIKNLNSFRFIDRAINYEVKRQTRIRESGKLPKQETRGYDPEKGITFSQRSKEIAKDYRYFPEPDIPPFFLSSKEISRIKRKVPEMPWVIEKKMLEQNIPISWFAIILSSKKIYHTYLDCLKKGKYSPLEIAKFLVNNTNLRTKSSQAIIKQIEKEREMFSVSEKEIKKIIKTVIVENQKAVTDFKKGKVQAIGFLIGQVQAKTKGKANPQLTKKIILEILK